MVSAPNTPPHKKTSTSATAQTTLGFQRELPNAGESSRLVLISRQRHQHIVGSMIGIEPWRVLLGHHGARRNAGAADPGLAYHQETAGRRQRQQRREDESPAKGEIQSEETGERGSRPLSFALHLRDYAGVELRGWGKRFFRAQRAEQLRDLLHALNLVPAKGAGAQMRLYYPEFRRFQQTGQILFEAIHHYRVHMFLPLQM